MKTTTKRRQIRSTKGAMDGIIAPGLKRLPVGKIQASDYNPRVDLQPGDAEYEKIKRSITEFGYVDPIIWNKRTGNIVGGHQRLKILVSEFGCEHVDVVVVDLDQSREKALNVALNSVVGLWDDAKLVALVRELDDETLIDATLTGFDEGEILELYEDELEPRVGGDNGGGGDTNNGDQSDNHTLGILITCDNKTDQQDICRQLKTHGIKHRKVKDL